MTNTKVLKQIIANSGLKIQYIAMRLGITRQAFNKKINNKSYFNQYEIEKLCKLLCIDSLDDCKVIFFANDVD